MSEVPMCVASPAAGAASCNPCASPNAARTLYRVSASLLGPADPSFRALSGGLKLTVRRHNFNKDSPPVVRADKWWCPLMVGT